MLEKYKNRDLYVKMTVTDFTRVKFTVSVSNNIRQIVRMNITMTLINVHAVTTEANIIMHIFYCLVMNGQTQTH